MKLMRRITLLRKSITSSHANSSIILQSRESFHSSILREQRRVDRNRHPLSLVLFNVGGQNTKKDITQQLTHILTDRIRSTDEAGWFDDKHIGIILPYTCADGAYKVAGEICKAFIPESSAPKYDVHTYPSNHSLDDNIQRNNFEIRDLPQRQKVVTSLPSTPAKFSQHTIFTAATSSFTRNDIGECKEVPQAIDPFFLQPLPTWKRVIDILGSCLGLILLSPVLLLIALIIKVKYGGPVIFKQQRVGYSGRIFTMWKFRTMRPGAQSSRHQQYMSKLIDDAHEESSAKAMTKLDADLPVTGFGKILRAMSLDEIPQLINVLRGDMTLVGPRPPTPYEVEHYLPWHCERFGAVPGMTGLWQVSGRNKLTFLDMIRLDIRYTRTLSVWLDILIFLKTPLVIAVDVVGFIYSLADHT